MPQLQTFSPCIFPHVSYALLVGHAHSDCNMYHVCSVLCEFRAEVEETAEFQARLSWLQYVTCEFYVEAEETAEFRARLSWLQYVTCEFCVEAEETVE
jgi:hypothetical protein